MYWKILNGNKQESIHASREHLLDHFKKIKAGNHDSDAESNEMVNNNAQINDNLEINCGITLKETEENVDMFVLYSVNTTRFVKKTNLIVLTLY